MSTILVSFSRLTNITTVGVTSSEKATINYEKNVVTMTIIENDNPYGVIGWKERIQVTNEKIEINSSVLIIIKREAGNYGNVTVFYETVVVSDVGMKERPAIPNVDFTPVKGNVTFLERQSEVYIYIEVNYVSFFILLVLYPVLKEGL